MNQTQGLSNVSYSIAHSKILEIHDRQRVGEQLTSILQNFLKIKSFKTLKILDVGCSNGIITQYIARNGGKIIGVDVDKKAIEESKNNVGSNLSFKLASGNNLPFGKNIFDIVICNQVYSYTSNPSKMMLEIYRVLKRGGICLFTGDNLLRPIEPLYNLPFIRLLPYKLTKYILKMFGYKNFYIGNYKTYWGLLKLCRNFIVTDYTLKILKQPKKYKFIKLLKYEKVVNLIPLSLLKVLEPFLPTFIFILRKN